MRWRACFAGLLLAALLLLLQLVRYPPRPALVRSRPVLPATHAIARPIATDAKLGAMLLQSLYVAGHSELCPALGARTRLVILVASARQAVRLTWGNVPKLLKFVKDPARRNATITVWGQVTKRAHVLRVPRYTHYVPAEQFPGKTYPDYTQGYLVTANEARRLLRAAPGERYLRMEDVFVTGVLAVRLRVRLVMQVPELSVYGRKEPDSCDLQNIIACHKVEYDKQFDLWQKLVNISSVYTS